MSYDTWVPPKRAQKNWVSHNATKRPGFHKIHKYAFRQKVPGRPFLNKKSPENQGFVETCQRKPEFTNSVHESRVSVNHAQKTRVSPNANKNSCLRQKEAKKSCYPQIASRRTGIRQKNPRKAAYGRTCQGKLGFLQNLTRRTGFHQKALRDGFGGLVVSMLAYSSRVRGFKPGRSRWIFRTFEKSSACLHSERK